MENKIRAAIKDRLLRMGLIKDSEKAHGHALDLLASDVMTVITGKTELERMVDK
jgi:hypothetical protein